jgi:hypothetical protein
MRLILRSNLVTFGDHFILARIHHIHKLPYYVLCKQITLAYRSLSILIEPTVALFDRLISTLQVKSATFDSSVALSNFYRFKLIVKTKLAYAK